MRDRGRARAVGVRTVLRPVIVCIEDDARRGEVGEEMVRAGDPTGARTVSGPHGPHGAHDRFCSSGAHRVPRSPLVLARAGASGASGASGATGAGGARDDRDGVV